MCDNQTQLLCWSALVCLSSSAVAEIAQHVSHWMPKLLLPKCKTPHFAIRHCIAGLSFTITGHYDPIKRKLKTHLYTEAFSR